MEARLIATSSFGKELRVKRAGNTWSGCQQTCPLQQDGLWFGDRRRHHSVDAEKLKALGFDDFRIRLATEELVWLKQRGKKNEN